MTDLPALVTLPNVDICAAGEWQLSTGPATFTTTDLANAVEASQCPAVGDPVIKIGHTDQRFDGEPAVGHVKNMATHSSGNKLAGDLADMPGWLGAVAGSAYPNRSIEGCWDFVCQIGHTHPFVVTALALLGVTGPGVGVLGSLPDVAALYGLADAAEVMAAKGEPGESWRLPIYGGAMAGTVLAAGVTTEDVRREYYDAANNVPLSYWITEIQIDPPQLIVSDEATAKVYRVPVQIDGSTVAFGDAQEVEIEYVDLPSVAASGQQRKVAASWPTAVASRGTEPAADADAAADAAMGETHGPFTGTHTHPHSAFGSQGDDDTHEHAHSHDGDAVHDHAHAAAASAGPTQEGVSDVEFTDEQITALRASLGLADDTELTPDVLVSAAGTLADANRTASAKAGRIGPDQMIVDRDAWDQQQKRIDRLEAAGRQRAVEQRDEVIKAAVKEGKFSAASIKRYQKMWDQDPDNAREIIASLKKNVVPVDDIGNPGGPLGDDEFDREYSELFPPSAR